MKSRLISIRKIIEKEVGHRIDTKNRTRGYTYARAIYCKIAREISGPKSYSLYEIGQEINRDHASVLHNLNVIFPFAIKEASFRRLYLTLKAIFVDQDRDLDNFDEVRTLGERVIALEKDNALLRQKMDVLKYGTGRFEHLIDGLSEEEYKEVYDKMEIFVKAIKNRVYL